MIVLHKHFGQQISFSFYTNPKLMFQKIEQVMFLVTHSEEGFLLHETQIHSMDLVVQFNN